MALSVSISGTFATAFFPPFNYLRLIQLCVVSMRDR